MKNQKTAQKFDKRPIPRLGWILGLFIAVDFSMAIFMTYSDPRWQTFVYLGSAFIAVGLVLSALLLLRNGQTNKAAFIIIIEITFRGLVTAFIFEGLGIAMHLLILSLSVLVLLEWMNTQSMRQVMPYVAVTSLVAMFFGFYKPAWQVDGPLPDGAQIWFIGVIFLVFGIYFLANIKKYSLRMKLISLFLVSAFGSIIMIAWITNLVAENTALENAQFALEFASQNLAKSIDQLFVNQLNSVKSLASSREIIDFITPSIRSGTQPNDIFKVDQLLENNLNLEQTSIESFLLIDPNGSVLLRTNSSDKVNKLEGKFLQQSFKNRSGFWSPIYFNDVTNAYFLSYGVPIFGDGNQPLGMLIARTNAEALQTLVRITNNQAGESSYAVVVDEFDIIVAHGYDNNFIQTPFTDSNDFPSQTTQLLGSSYPTQVQPWKVLFLQPESAIKDTSQFRVNVFIVFAEIVAVFIVIIGNIGIRNFTLPINNLIEASQEISQGNLKARATIATQDEFGAFARTFNSMAELLETIMTDLDQQILERTRTIDLASKIGRKISSSLNMHDIVDLVVEEIKTSFGYYHVKIYLVVENVKELNIVSGTGEVGKKLIESSHPISFGHGVIGKAASDLKTIVVEDTRHSNDWVLNPLLPDTKSEIAVPIMIGSSLLGILDIQHDEPNGLGKGDVDLMELIASQTAIALRNAYQFQQAQLSLARQEKIAEVSEKIRSTSDFAEAIKIAAQEISLLTGSKKIITRFFNSG